MASHPLDHPLLPIWLGLLSRCHSPSNPAYRHYGGRGIHVAERWMHFPHFVTDMGPRPSPKHSVERNDVNTGYGPGNCRWATTQEQARNTRRTIWLTFNGERRCLSEWAERTGISSITLATRLKRGWPVEVALTAKPTKDGFGKRVLQRRTQELCDAAGVTRSTFYYRLSKGWTEQEALSVPARPPRPDLADRCRAVGIEISTFYARLRRGWTEEHALSTAPRLTPDTDVQHQE